MSIKLLAIFGMSVLVIQSSSVLVLAQTNTNTTATNEKTLEQRIAERKTLLKTKLDAAAQTRIKARCAAAQKLVTTAKTRSDKAVENRQKAYEAVQTRLSSLLAALEKNGVDTSSIKELQTQVKTAVDKLKSDVAAYNQTLSDLSSMGCTTDPAGFKATLETARTQRQQIVKDLVALRTLKGKIISELAKLKSGANSDTNSGGTQ